MYKGASQGMQRAHRVDKPMPTGGYIGGQDDASDLLPNPATLPTSELREELFRLRGELARHEQFMAVARVTKDKRGASQLGPIKASITVRIAAIKRLLTERDGPNELQRLGCAIREIAGDELADRIFARAKELRSERDSDGSPKGGDGEAAPLATARPEGIAR